MNMSRSFVENVLTPILTAIVIYKLPIINIWLRIAVGLLILGALCFITDCFIDKEYKDNDYPSIVLIIMVIISLIMSFVISIFDIIKFICLFIKNKITGKKNIEEKGN